MNKRFRALALFLALALVSAACASEVSNLRGAEDSALVDAEAPSTTVPAKGQILLNTAPGALDVSDEVLEEAADRLQKELGDGGIDAVVVPVDFGRDIIYVANLAVSVNDVAAASREATQIIQGLGGFVFGQSTSGGANATSVLTFKVLPEDFSTALDRLGGLGEVRNQQITSDDVTERVVNLESRIITAEASVARLQEFLANATDINTIANLERELLERETQLETLRGQLRTLQDQVALATITVTISEKHSAPAIAVFVSAYEGHNNGVSCPGGEIFRVEEESALTLCYEVINVGDTALDSIQLIDSGSLKLELDDMTVVSGDPTLTLEPGDSFTLAYETVAIDNIRFITNVTATPVDADGEPVGSRTVGDSYSSTITTFEPEGIPTFMDGLEASWSVFVAAVLYVVLALGAAIPFLVPAVLIWWLWQKRPRRAIDEPTPIAEEEGEELVNV